MKLQSTLKCYLIAAITSVALTSCSDNSEKSNSESVITETENKKVEQKKSTTVIGSLEVAAYDNSTPLGWGEAIKKCNEMGNGWRLPTIEELHILYENREKIGGFETGGAFCAYWSSTRDEYEDSQILTLSFHDGLRYPQVLGVANKSFRAVRDKK